MLKTKKKPKPKPKLWEPTEIRELRHAIGETQAAFADRIGVSYRCVVSWERPLQRADGKPNPDRRPAPLWAKKLFERMESELLGK